MNVKKFLITAWILVMCAFAGGDEQTTEHKIRIYLPRDKTVSSNVIDLKQIAVILGDEALTQCANAIQLGQFTVPGQIIQIDRNTILSCLAGSGIKASSVVFNGAETISVSRHEDMIPAERFIKTAQEYLQENLTEHQVKTLKLTRSIKDYLLNEENSQVILKPVLSERQSSRIKYVTVQVIRDGIVLGRRELAFSVQYSCLRLVAKESLSAGSIITPNNTTLQEYMSDTPEAFSSSSFYGMAAKRDISSGTEVTHAMIEQKESPIMIRKQDKVILKLDMGGLFVSTTGEAIEDGRLGDIISVQRGSRKTRDLKIVLGEVMADGTIRPIL